MTIDEERQSGQQSETCAQDIEYKCSQRTSAIERRAIAARRDYIDEVSSGRPIDFEMATIAKGGVWTNVEDEILKAAIAKYGLNQWARISSLLVRKTPKQCKARWREWLDPSIRKVEWTRDEDEKLLHSAKLFPSQWRTIAGVVGRTSTQCLERYQKLLDDADAADGTGVGAAGDLSLTGPGAEAAAPTADSVRRLRPGELDPDPENKPARPDAVDMDDEEKEMLSEARARLANTMGKKAKRKQREKLLEETKRISTIQKRRELKAAGVNMRLRHHKDGETDYNVDIPLEHRPAPGFYDTTEEDERNERERQNFDLKKMNQDPKGEKRKDKFATDDGEGENKRKNKSRQKDDDKLSTQLAHLKRVQEMEQVVKRRKLELPAPQVSDAEIRELVKLGHSTAEARQLAVEASNGPASASAGLLTDSSAMGPPSRTARTPRVDAAHDEVLLEARDQLVNIGTQSALYGGQATPVIDRLQGKGRAANQTPSLLRRSIASTPAYGDDYGDEQTELGSVAGGSDAGVDYGAELRSKFAALPLPKNEFELELPSDDDSDAASDLDGEVEDAEERDARLLEQQAEARRRTWLQQSQVVQRGLPRPRHVDLQAMLAHADRQARTLSPAAKMIAVEAARLIVSDAAKFPVAGGSIRGAALIEPDFALADIESSRQLIADERAVEAHTDRLHPSLSAATKPASAKLDIKLARAQLHAVQRELLADAERAGRFERLLGDATREQMQNIDHYNTKLGQAFDAVQEARIEQLSFDALRQFEVVAAPVRLAALKEEVDILERFQRREQDRFELLSRQKEDLLMSMM